MLTQKEKRALMSEVERLNGDILFRLHPSPHIAQAIYRKHLIAFSPAPKNRRYFIVPKNALYIATRKRFIDALWIAAIVLLAAVASALMHWGLNP